jgi:hypothetical protein
MVLPWKRTIALMRTENDKDTKKSINTSKDKKLVCRRMARINQEKGRLMWTAEKTSFLEG